MRITFNNAHKLRCGHTIWRCMASTNGGVSIHEVTLRGKKIIHAFKRWSENFPSHTALRIEPKTDYARGGYFLNDIHGHGAEWIAAFTTRREALRWKAQVEAGWNISAVVAAEDHRREMDSWDAYDDREDAFYDYDGPDNDYYDPHSEVVAREPLYQSASDEANDDRFALEG